MTVRAWATEGDEAGVHEMMPHCQRQQVEAVCFRPADCTLFKPSFDKHVNLHNPFEKHVNLYFPFVKLHFPFDERMNLPVCPLSH